MFDDGLADCKRATVLDPANKAVPKLQKKLQTQVDAQKKEGESILWQNVWINSSRSDSNKLVGGGIDSLFGYSACPRVYCICL